LSHHSSILIFIGYKNHIPTHCKVGCPKKIDKLTIHLLTSDQYIILL